MIGTLKKAMWLIRSRPALVAATVRQYALFACTRVLGRWFFTPAQGIRLAENVRVQRVSCLSAERPGASVEIGRDSIVYEHARIQAYGGGRISIGDTSIIGDARIYSRASIRIGSRVVTSWNVFIQDFDAHPIDPELRARQMRAMCAGERFNWEFPVAPIEIGNDVWIGANVTILKGARIGDGCVIAAGAVVPAGEWPARSVLAGVPARVVKNL